MAEFVWEPLEFLDALGVAPEEAEDGISFHYKLTRGDLRLELTVWPLDGDVSLSLHSPSQTEPAVDLRLLDCPGARVVSEKRGKFIEFSGANLFSGRYDLKAAAPYGFRLWVDPYLQIVPFSYET